MFLTIVLRENKMQGFWAALWAAHNGAVGLGPSNRGTPPSFLPSHHRRRAPLLSCCRSHSLAAPHTSPLCSPHEGERRIRPSLRRRSALPLGTSTRRGGVPRPVRSPFPAPVQASYSSSSCSVTLTTGTIQSRLCTADLCCTQLVLVKWFLVAETSEQEP